MADDLPSEYDVIVLGTGMPECILAASSSRIGKQVLHMDRYEFYGADWATFNFDGLQEWVRKFEGAEYNEPQAENPGWYELLKEGEIPHSVQSLRTVCNVKQRWFVPEVTPLLESNEVLVQQAPNEENAKQESYQHENHINNEHQADEVPDVDGDLGAVAGNAQSAEVEASASANSSQALEVDAQSAVVQEEWSVQKIRSFYRKFNLDLAPKLLFSRGDLVELLISSNIARYAEFKSVTRVLTVLNGKLEQVPCSRSDVFSTRNVTVVEKRMLMKLLTFCLEYEAHPEEYEGFENKTFLEFLKSRKLTTNVVHYIVHSIAMVSEKASTLEGLLATQRFLQSLGRFGNTPFLWPLYGSGELPQCFCRLCAVYGGIYYLKRDIEAMILDADGKCTAVISNGARLNCKWLVLGSCYSLPDLYPEHYKQRYISRGIFLTTKSLLPAEKEQLTFLRLPVANGLKVPVWIVELGSGAMACPANLYVVHLTSPTLTNAEEDLAPALKLLFNVEDEASCSNVSELPNVTDKPKIVWSLYFNLLDGTQSYFDYQSPSNVLHTSGPGDCIDFDISVKQAKEIFQRTFPDEEFLPRAPDPEDIIIEGAEESNPGPGFHESDNPEGQLSSDQGPSVITSAEDSTGNNQPECTESTLHNENEMNIAKSSTESEKQDCSNND